LPRPDDQLRGILVLSVFNAALDLRFEYNMKKADLMKAAMGRMQSEMPSPSNFYTNNIGKEGEWSNKELERISFTSETSAMHLCKQPLLMRSVQP